MSVNKYQMFLKTVECGSFSKAAEEMNFTQSAVSHAVQALENELGVTLLSRNRGGVVLTADGRLLLPRIEKLCAAHHELMRSAAELKGMDAGYVRVATFSSVSAQWLPSILKSFGERYPNIEFEVLTGDYYGQSEDWILQGKVDCGFLRLPSVKRLQTYPLHRDEQTLHRWQIGRAHAGGQRPLPCRGADHGAVYPAGGRTGLRDHGGTGQNGHPPQHQVHRPGGSHHAGHGVQGAGHQPAAGADGAAQPLSRDRLPRAGAVLPQHRHRRKGQEGNVRRHAAVRGLCAAVGG